MHSNLLTLTNLIVAITVVISYIGFTHRELINKLIFHPVSVDKGKQYQRFLSSGFIHADMNHLFINMFVLWSFGNAIEKNYYLEFLGEPVWLNFLILYLGGIIFASVPSFLRHKNDRHYKALGASGGVSAVVFACIVFAPWQNLYLFAVMPMPQIIAGAAYLAYSWYRDKNHNDNIGHMAHFAGAIWGVVITLVMQPKLIARFFELTMQGPTWMN